MKKRILASIVLKTLPMFHLVIIGSKSQFTSEPSPINKIYKEVVMGQGGNVSPHQSNSAARNTYLAAY